MVSRTMRALHAVLEAIDHVLDVGGAIGRDLQPDWLKDWHVDVIIYVLAAVFLFGFVRAAIHFIEALAKKVGAFCAWVVRNCRYARLIGYIVKRRCRQIGKRVREIWILLTRWW